MVKDVTHELLRGDDDTPAFRLVFSEPRNRALLDAFLRNNLTIDLVLDKISRHGMAALTPVDLHVLTQTTGPRSH